MTITRRHALTWALSAAALTTGCARTADRAMHQVHRVRYGADESQVAELHLPTGDGVVPVAVVIHGGFWTSSYGMELATPLVKDLAAHGIAGYAIEYRRVGNGGGWPATFEDVATAIDALKAQRRLDLGKVVAVGHSAGGHLAVWAAGRQNLPSAAPGAAPKVILKGAVSQAGILDLVGGVRENLGGQAVQSLMGADPAADRARYELASPYERLPLKVPVALVHGDHDRIVPLGQSQRYRDAATRAGDNVTLTELPNAGHFELIDTDHAAWRICRDEIERLQRS
ncbi:alpha/beta fold hydrolase [Kribbella catacumbae]|uniref:alpha/beta fold hydrolase n=1 Tax=Kribbella catacumbae TaxID=460086 RepID=UPI0003655A1F